MKEDIDVTSPTYNIIQTYQPYKGPAIWHMDFYRLNNRVDINDLDLDEAFSKAISIIEWPEKLDNIIPKIRTSIRFDFIDKIPSKREIQVKSISCNFL